LAEKDYENYLIQSTKASYTGFNMNVGSEPKMFLDGNGSVPAPKGNMSDSNLNFMTEAISSLTQQIERNRSIVDKYDENNWAKDDNFNKRSAQITQLENKVEELNSLFLQSMTHGDVAFTMADIAYNEAAGLPKTTMETIIHGYLNKTGDNYREPEGAEISHFKNHHEEFDSLSTTEQLIFINSYMNAIEASVSTLTTHNRPENDLANGAKHWVSPKSLPKPPQNTNNYYLRDFDGQDVWFPDWALPNGHEDVINYIREGKYDTNYNEFTITNIDKWDFLFYNGVR